MFKKYFQDFIQTLFKESQKHQTKQRNIKDTKIGISHARALIKPETLAISGNNEKHDSSADRLMLTRLFDAVFKKFVNPKLDLMATLEQIKSMEAKRREDVLTALQGFLNFETRSRVPALPATTSALKYDKSLAPDEMSTGWTGQPTVKKITCNVETSSRPRGFDYALLNFPDFKEDFEKCCPPQTEPPVVRLRKSRSRSNTRGRKRRKISPERTPAPEVSKVNASKITVDIFKDAAFNSSDGKNLNEQAIDTEKVQQKSTASVGSTNNNKPLTINSLQVQSLDKNSSSKLSNSPEPLQGFEHSKYKSVQEVALIGQKSKGEIAKDTINDFVSSTHQNKLHSEPNISQSAGDNMDFNKGHITQTYGAEQMFNNKPIAHASNKELERVVYGKGKDHGTKYDQNEQNRNFVNNYYGNYPIGIDSHTRELPVDKGSTSGSEIINQSNFKTVDISTNDEKDKKSSEFNIPRQLIENSPGTASLKGASYANLEQVKPPIKIINKTAPKPIKANAIKSINRKEDILKENKIIDDKKKSIVRNTKSESNLNSERKIIEADRQFSKGSLKKLKNSKISVQANYLKHIGRKAWFQGPHEKIGEQNQSNVDKGPHSKIKLPKIVKLPENVRDIISKGASFKAGNYKARSKHFLREKFPSAVSLKGKILKVPKTSASKKSLNMHVDNNLNSSKIKVNKKRVSFPSKQASKENVAISYVKTSRPRTALTVKGIKRTKVLSNSNQSTESINRGPVSFKEATKPRGDKGVSKLSIYANKVRLSNSKTKLFNKGNSSTSAQNNFNVKLNNHKYLNNKKPAYVQKKQSISQSKYNVVNRIKKITLLDESKLGQKTNPTGSTLNASKVRRRHSAKPKPKPIILKMYGRGRGSAFGHPASNNHTVNSVGIITPGKQLKRPTKTILSSQTSYSKDKSLRNTNSSRVVNRSVPIKNLHVRSFSTIRNYELRAKMLSAISTKSTPLLNNDRQEKGRKKKKSTVANLRSKLSHGSNAAINIDENIRYKKKGYKPQKSWITIKNGVYIKKDNHILTTVSNPPEGGNRIKRKHRKKSLKRKPKSNHVLALENDDQVGTSSKTDKSAGENELNVKVLYKRHCDSSKMKLNSNSSETNVHIDLPVIELERPNLPTQVNNVSVISSQMVKNVVDKSENRTNLGPLKVLVPHSGENDDSHVRRRWKSKAERLHRLIFYNKENKLVQNLNKNLANTSRFQNNTAQTNERSAQSANYKSVSLVDKLNKDVERLTNNINKYRFPRHSQKYSSERYLSNSYKEPRMDLGGYRNNNIPEIRQDSKKNISKSNNDSNAKIAKEGGKCNDEQNLTLVNTRDKISLAQLNLDEVPESQQLIKPVFDINSQNTVHKIRLSGNHLGFKGFTGAPNKLSVPATKTSSQQKSKLEYRYLDSIVSKLLTQEKDNNAPNTKSANRYNESKTQPHKFKSVLQDRKSFESIIKYYKPETHITNKPLHVARSVNENNSSKLSGGKVFAKNIGLVDESMNSKVASEEQLTEINTSVGTEIQTHTVKKNAVDKIVKLNKQLERLRTVIRDNEKKKEFINIELSQVPNTEKKGEKIKHMLPKKFVTTMPTLNKLIRNISISKDDKIKSIQSKVTSKINTVDNNKEIVNMKKVNRNMESTKTFEEIFGLSNNQNRNTLHEDLLRATQKMKNGSPAYANNIKSEKRKPTHIINKPNLSKISNKIRRETSKPAKETLKCSEKSTISTSKPAGNKIKTNKAQTQSLQSSKMANKVTEDTFSSNSSANKHLSNKRSSSLKSTLIKDNIVNIYDYDEDTKALKFDTNKHIVHDRSSREASNKDKITRKAEMPYIINKQILLHQTNNSEPSKAKEFVKCSEKGSTSLKNNKKIATEIISTSIKPLNTSNTISKVSNRGVTKATTLTQSPVRGSKTSIPQFPSSESSEPGKISQAVMNNLPIQHKNLTHAVFYKNESKMQNTSIDTRKQSGKGATKVTQGNKISYDRSFGTMRGWDINLGLEPGFL